MNEEISKRYFRPLILLANFRFLRLFLTLKFLYSEIEFEKRTTSHYRFTQTSHDSTLLPNPIAAHPHPYFVSSHRRRLFARDCKKIKFKKYCFKIPRSTFPFTRQLPHSHHLLWWLCKLKVILTRFVVVLLTFLLLKWRHLFSFSGVFFLKSMNFLFTN